MGSRPNLNLILHVATLVAALAAAWGAQGTRISNLQDQLTEVKTQVAGVQTQVNQIPALAIQIHDLKEEFHHGLQLAQ